MDKDLDSSVTLIDNGEERDSDSEDVLNYTCKFPVKLSSRLIGTEGQNIQMIMLKTGVTIRLNPDPDSSLFKLCSIRGRERQINCALAMISSDDRFSDIDLSPVEVTTHKPFHMHSKTLYPGTMAGTSKEQEDSPMKTGLLSSIEAVFEQNRKEDEKRKQALKTRREAELIHSKCLKSESSPQDLSEAKFVMDQWANKHCSRKMKAISKEAADRRSHTNKPYSRPNEGSQSNVAKINSRFGTSLYSPVQNKDFSKNIRTVNNIKGGQSSASTSTKSSPPCSSNVGTPNNIKSETPSKSTNYSFIELSSDEESIINISDTCLHDNSDFISLHNRDSDDVMIQVQGSSEKKKKLKEAISSVTHENMEEEGLVKCPVMNCNCKFRSKEGFQSHMDSFEHSPNNPWFDYVCGQEENSVMCPVCGKIFENTERCEDHMKSKEYNHPLPPLPVAGYMCTQCLSVFPNQKSCLLHISERKHIRPVFQFSDDTVQVAYNRGVPLSKTFFQDYFKKCMECDFHIKCCDCELSIKTPRELEQHYQETKLTHHCMALTDVQKSDIFESYLSTNVCSACQAVVNDPNQNSGYHNCSESLGGKVTIDGCKSFRSLILGQCIRLEQEQMRKEKERASSVSKPEPRVSSDTTPEPRASSVPKPEPRTSWVPKPEPMTLSVPKPKPRASSVPSPEPMEVMPYTTKVINRNTEDKPGPSKRPRHFSESSTITGSNGDEEENEVFPGPSYLKKMVNIIFLDLDNWGGFFKKLPNRLPPKTFVWGFYGGKTNWTEPVQCRAFEYQKREKRFYLHEQCGRTKDAADFAICLTVGKMDMCLPSTVHFTILSGDKGFCEIERQMKSSKRKAVVIDPHQAMKMSNQVLYTMIVSVGDS